MEIAKEREININPKCIFFTKKKVKKERKKSQEKKEKSRKRRKRRRNEITVKNGANQIRNYFNFDPTVIKK